MHRLKIESALGRFSSENRKNGPQTSISVAIYLLFASVFGNPLWAFHASLSPTISSYPQFRRPRSRVPFFSLGSRLLAEGLGSIHDAIHIAFCRIKFQSACFPYTPLDAPWRRTHALFVQPIQSQPILSWRPCRPSLGDLPDRLECMCEYPICFR